MNIAVLLLTYLHVLLLIYLLPTCLVDLPITYMCHVVSIPITYMSGC